MEERTAVVYSYRQFLRRRHPAVASSRIPDKVMIWVMIPAVLTFEAAWLALLSYLGASAALSLLSSLAS